MGVLDKLDILVEQSPKTSSKRCLFTTIMFATLVLVVVYAFFITIYDTNPNEEIKEIERNLTDKLSMIIAAPLTIDCGEDWFQSDTKCFKIFAKEVDKSEAKQNCSQLEASLLTIATEEEEHFVDQLLKANNVSSNVWIDLEKTEDGQFQWPDSSDLFYHNFGPIGDQSCVQLKVSAQEGQWTDTACDALGFFVCQKFPNRDTEVAYQLKSLNTAVDSLKKSHIEELYRRLATLEAENSALRETVEEQTRDVNSLFSIVRDQNAQNAAQNSAISGQVSGLADKLIPVGMLYTQLPNQSSPEQLWPRFQWQDITSQYAGLFFRAEGDTSAPFGQIQMANSSDVTNIWTQCINGVTNRGSSAKMHYELKAGVWGAAVCGSALHDMRIYKARGEIRPKNTAIRLWKRVL